MISARQFYVCRTIILRTFLLFIGKLFYLLPNAGFSKRSCSSSNGGFRNGRAKSDGSEPVEFEWAVVARFVQAIGLVDFAAFSPVDGLGPV